MLKQSWIFPKYWYKQCKLRQHLIFLQISELFSIKQPRNSIQLPKPTRNTHKNVNHLVTAASGEKKACKVSTILVYHGWRCNKAKRKYILYMIKKNNIRSISCTLTVVANEHHSVVWLKVPIMIWPSGGLCLVTDKKQINQGKLRTVLGPWPHG